MFNFLIICFISAVVVGLMEAIKVFLPKDFNAKITTIISLALSFIVAVGFGIIAKFSVLDIVVNTVGVLGLVQTSYNFVLKLLKKLIEKIQTSIPTLEDKKD